MTIIATKIKPDMVLIEIILSNPTPTVSNTLDEDSANIPINGNTIIAKIKHIPKLCNASPSGLDNGSTNPE